MRRVNIATPLRSMPLKGQRKSSWQGSQTQISGRRPSDIRGLLAEHRPDRTEGRRSSLHESEYQANDDRYQAGQRRQCPIEIEINLPAVIEGGFIAFRTRAGAILACMDLPKDFIVSAIDTQQKVVLWHKSLRETEAERISQEFATENPKGSHPPTANFSDGRKLCPECSSEQVSGTAQRNVCGFLFDVGPEEVGTREEIAAAKSEWVLHRRDLVIRRKEKQAEVLRKLGFEELNSRVLQEIDYEHEQFVGREGRGFSSREADITLEARNKLKRAEKLGYKCVRQRFMNDGQLRYRMTSFGRMIEQMELYDFFAHVNLPNPGRDSTTIRSCSVLVPTPHWTMQDGSYATSARTTLPSSHRW